MAIQSFAELFRPINLLEINAFEEETGKLEGSKKCDCWKEYI